MPAYVAFLRAINLGAQRKFPMAELRACLTEAGYGDVETYLHTGNARVTTPRRSCQQVSADLEKLFRERVGFEVPTVVMTPAEVADLLARAEALDVAAQRRYFTLLKESLPSEASTEIGRWSVPGEGARAFGRAVYWWLDHPNQQAKAGNATWERYAGPGTTRDHKVLAAVVARWCR